MKRSTVTWAVLLAFALGCVLSWYLTRRQFLDALAFASREMQVSYINHQRLKTAIARQVFLGRGAEWAEVQLKDVPLRVFGITPEPPDGMVWTHLLCEIEATSLATNRAVPYPAIEGMIQSEKVRKVCERYKPGEFMAPGNWD